MKDILSKQLILKVSGEVQASNIKEFEVDILAGIENIKTDLVTDQDFAEAKEAAKSCKTLESWLDNALEEAVLSMQTVAEVRQIADRLKIKLRNTRLDLSKKIKAEEAARKQEIVNEGITNVQECLKDSPVKHAMSVNTVAINDAIKGKRSLEKMREAVVDAAFNQIEAITLLERLFLSNSKLIQDTEKEYPGLFPDVKVVALSPVEVVEAQIESRVNKFKFDLQQKQEAERKAKEAAELKAKQEAEAKAKEEAESKLEPEPLSQPEIKQEMAEHFSPVSFGSSSSSRKPEPMAFGAPMQEEQPEDDGEYFTITICAHSGRTDNVINAIRQHTDVKSVKMGL